MNLEYPSEDDIRRVALDMRETDYREFIALSDQSTREGLALQLAVRFAGREDIFMASWAGWPVAVGGLIELRPHVVTLAMFATDDLPKIGGPLTKVLKGMFSDVKRTGVHRIEAVSMVGHDDAHRWIQALGLAPEGGPMRGYGKGGEAYQQFAWVADAC